MEYMWQILFQRQSLLDIFYNKKLLYLSKNLKDMPYNFPKLLLIWYTEDIVCRLEENKLFLRNVERVNPALAEKTTACDLEGKHCSGWKQRPSGETPPYVKLLLEFMDRTP